MSEDREPEQTPEISPGITLLVPLTLGGVILLVAALWSARVVDRDAADEARANLTEAKELLRNSVDLIEEGQYEKAAALATKVVLLAPDLHTGYFVRAQARVGMKEYAVAIEDYTRSIRLNPNIGDTYYDYYHRGQAYVLIGDDMAAERDFSQALRMQKHHGRSYLARALVRKRLGDVNGAKADLAAAGRLGLTPGD